VLEIVRPLISARYAAAPARIGDLEHLVSAAHAAEAAGQSLPAWLASLVLDPPVSSGDLAGPPHLDEDFLVVSTVHSAKGLEWSVVHLAHLVDGAFPADMALGTSEGLAEEQRLFYVAVTRARDELYLYTPLRMPHHRFAYDDRYSLAPKSRFLDSTVMSLLDVEEVPARASIMLTRVPIAATSGRRRGPAVDLSNLWT
jgi:DNA helicase-2/ATP-dependent DNA helicase PcrA